MKLINGMKMFTKSCRMKLLTAALTWGLFTVANAQNAVSLVSAERESDLIMVPMDSHGERVEQVAHRHPLNERGGAISLPFFDDFSTPSMPGPGFAEFEMYQRWEEGSARITQTYALNAPTIGTATLEGLDRDGYPYSFTNVNTPGWADTLTSLPIALNGYFPESNVHLMFYVQGGGRGNAPEPGTDQLILEFKSTDDVSGEVFWTEVWASTEVFTDEFDRVFVPVNEAQWLDNDFQFRFRNWGALGGNVDLWHLDYILLDDQIDPSTFEVFSEVAIVEPVNTFLREYTRMPWNHFVPNPEFYMRDSLVVKQRNLSATQSDNVETGFSVDYIDSVEVIPNLFQNTQVLPQSQFTTPLYLGSDQDGQTVYTYNVSSDDSCAIWDVSVWQSSIGLLHTEKVGVPDNDSIIFQQVFLNDFAYDDGTAEKAYALTAAGASLAVGFSLEVPDTLLGLAIHFTPYYTNVDDEVFLLRAWEDSAGFPGAELVDSQEFQSFQTPQYFNDGYDLFAYYPYDDPIPVSGTIHVGMVQSGDAELNFGLDKNTNANAGHLHYKLGLGGAWANSDIEGSVMIRPVLRANKQETWTDVAWTGNPHPQQLHSYPNPISNGTVQVEIPDAGGWTLYNNSGQVLQSGFWPAPGTYRISLESLSAGMYLLRSDSGQSVRLLLE